MNLIKLLITYYHFIMKVSSSPEVLSSEDIAAYYLGNDKGLFGKRKNKDVLESAELQEMFTHLVDSINTGLDFNHIREFIDYVLFAEKCFFYQNELDVEKDYSILAAPEELVILDSKDKVKITYHFDETEVYDINAINNAKNDSLNSYLDTGIMNPTNTMTVVDIIIERLFGNNKKTMFKFIIPECITRNEEERIMLDYITRLTYKILFEHILFDILDLSYKALDKKGVNARYVCDYYTL